MARKRTAPAKPELVLVRATVNLHGLRAGRLVWVDPAEEWIAGALAASWIVEEKPGPGDTPPQYPADLAE